IQRIAGGDLKSRIYIRNGDQLEEMAKTLNLMIQSLNRKVSSLRGGITELSRKAEAEGISVDILKDIRSIEENLDEMFEL
ncbi:HAMP domain-containing protein, partial [Desulfamplus magnetovallimortis]